jgi:hypothetical protein
MTRHIGTLTLATISCALALNAQSGNPLVPEAKQAYTGVKTNLLKAAEKMPADGYDFKPTPEIRTFGALMAHIADSNMRSCSAAKGETKEATAASKTSKADLVAAMKDSLAECDSAFDALTDANANEMVKFRNGQRARLAILIYNTGHDLEEYGYTAVYLRLKGIVPPSSERR